MLNETLQPTGIVAEAHVNTISIAPIESGRVIRTTVTVIRQTSNISLEDYAHGVMNGTLPVLDNIQFKNMYGALREHLDTVSAYLESFGLVVHNAYRRGSKIDVSGTAEQFNNAFSINLVDVETESKTYQSYTGEVHLPEQIKNLVQNVRLDNRSQPVSKPQPLVGSEFTSLALTRLTPIQVANAYNFPAHEGTGTTIAIWANGGGYTNDNLTSTFSPLGLTPPTIVDIFTGFFSNSPDTTDSSVELMLDICVAGGVVPKSKLVIIWANSAVDFIETAIFDTTNNIGVASISIATPENYFTSFTLREQSETMLAAAALGIPVCAASGDWGAKAVTSASDYTALLPSANPYVISVGGTSLELSGSTIVSEVPWIKSGGGETTSYDIPFYQAGRGLTVTTSPGGVTRPLTKRGFPDLAVNSDGNSGYEFYYGPSNTFTSAGGTSAGAPLIAGLLARITGILGKKVGFINKILYDNPSIFRDLTTGNNAYLGAGYSSTVGWDPVTGLGVPDGTLLKNAILAGTSLTATVITNSISLSQTIATTGNHLGIEIEPVKGTGGTPPYSYTIDPTLPTGLTFNTATAGFRGTATVSLLTTTFSVTVTDSLAAKSTGTFSLEVLPISTDANLSAMTFSTGSVSPPFSASTTSYTVSVLNSEASITVTPTSNNAYATITVAGPAGGGAPVTSGTASNPINLTLLPPPGGYSFTIVVTAQDGVTTKTYNVAVNKVASFSNDANLSALTISSGTLAPTFSSGTTSYTASVANGVSSVTVTPTVNQANATVKVNGTSVTSGSPSSSISLSVGANTITTVVTAQDGSTKTYTVVITRAPVVHWAITATTLVSGFSLVKDAIFTPFAPVTAVGGTGTLHYSVLPSLPTGLLYSTTTGIMSGTATSTSSLTTYNVTVNDDGIDTTSSSFSMRVLEFGLVAVVNNPYNVFIQNASFTPFTPVSGTGGVGTYTYVINPALPQGLSLTTATGLISGTPVEVTPLVSYTINVNDEGQATSPGIFKMAIAEPLATNLAIPVKSIPTNFTVAAFAPVTATGGFSTLTYTISPALSAGISLNSSTGYISGTPTASRNATSYTVTVTDSKPTPQTSSKTFQLTVSRSTISTILAIPSKVMTVGVTTSSFAPVTAIGGEGTLFYSISPALPTGLSFSTSTGIISGVPTVGIEQATFTVTVSDVFSQSSSKSFLLDINDPLGLVVRVAVPVKNLIKDAKVVPFSPVVASGGYGVPTYTVSPTLPQGLSFNSSTGKLTGKPIILMSTSTYVVTVRDQSTQVFTRSFDLSVKQAPALTSSITSATVSAHTYYDTVNVIPVTGSGGYGNLTYTVSPELPAGLMYESDTGRLYGTAISTATGVYTVLVTDQAEQSSQKNFTLNVTKLALTATKAVPSLTLQQWYPLLTPVRPITATGGIPPLRYAVSPPLPVGMSYSSTNGAVSGTPSQAISTTTFTVTVVDATTVTTTSSSFNLKVNSVSPQTGTNWITPGGLLSTVTELVSTTLTVALAETGTTYTLLSGTLPEGLTLSSDGVISGIPGAVLR